MKKYTLLLSFLVLPLLSYGQALISWDVAGVHADADLGSAPYTLSGTASANISGGNLTLGAGVNPSAANNQYGFKVSNDNKQTTLAGAISSNHYMQFTATAASGYVFNVTSITIAGESGSTGAADIALMTSVDGFTVGKEIKSVSEKAGVTGGFDSDASGFGAINLSGSQYENLSSITFRIYGWNTSGTSGVTYIRNLSGSDLVINGTTAVSAVPEPSTYALIFGAAMLGFCVYRRRTKQAA